MTTYIVEGVQEIPPVFVVEANSEKEAVTKAWNGDVLNDYRLTDNADSAVNVRKKSWTAKEA